MSVKALCRIIGTACLLYAWSASAVGTTVTYQGRLEQSGVPRNGACDFTFSLFDAPANGAQIDGTQALSDVTVTNGTFTVRLDFGAAAFTGPDRWLQVGVRCPAGSGSFVTLDPRQAITAAPYAVLANTVASDAVTSAKILDGSIATGDLANQSVTDAKVASGISYGKLQGAPSSLPPSGPAGGSLVGTYPNPGVASNSIGSAQIIDGQVGTAELMDGAITSSKILPAPIDQAVLTSLYADPGYLAVWVPPTPTWTLAGNAPTGSDSFLGTTNYKPLEVRVNNTRVMWLAPPSQSDAAAIARGSNNILMGSRWNAYESAFANQTISGGGVDNGDDPSLSTANYAAGHGATIGGGAGNSARFGDYGTVGGGRQNRAGGPYATVPGGFLNEATGFGSFAAGQNAHATHKGAFVWSDGTRRGFSNADYQFNVTATGGVSFWHDPTSTRHCDLTPNAVGWSCTSDRDAKENFVAVDSSDVLRRVNAMPITWWNLKGADPSDKHIGPVAQDFHDTFDVGAETTINAMDAQGIAFAAIQGLHRLVQEKDAQIAALTSRVAALERQAQPARR